MSLWSRDGDRIQKLLKYKILSVSCHYTRSSPCVNEMGKIFIYTPRKCGSATALKDPKLFSRMSNKSTKLILGVAIKPWLLLLSLDIQLELEIAFAFYDPIYFVPLIIVYWFLCVICKWCILHFKEENMCSCSFLYFHFLLRLT